VLIEGEFNAMSGYQAAGGNVDFLSLGAAGYHLDIIAHGPVLARYHAIRAVYDPDKAGNQGAARLLAAVPSIRRATVPVIESGDKDLSDYHRHGGNVPGWVDSIFSETAQAVETEAA
jgi:hypothetical protein